MTDDIRKDFWKSLSHSPFVMLRLEGGGAHALPMTAQLDKDLGPKKGGAVWFFTQTGSRIAQGGKAMAQFSSKGHDVFACMRGTLVEERDAAVIDRFWSNPIEAWYEGGRNDPHLLVFRFDIDNVEIWTADMGVKGYFKLMTGAAIDPGEAGRHSEIAV